MNKKGAVWPITLINEIFSVLLIIMGILMVASLIKSAGLNIESFTQTAQASLLAARLLNAADCYAYEEPYVENGQTKYQVHYGVIDLAKFPENLADIVESLDCIGGKEIDIELESFDGSINPLKSKKIKRGVRNTYFVRMFKNGKFYDGIMRLTIGS